MNRISSIVVILVLLGNVEFARSQDISRQRAADFVGMCEDPKQADRYAYCIGFMHGLSFGSQMVRIVTAAGQKDLFCAPAGTKLSDFINTFLDEMKKHPESMNDNGPAAIFLSLSRRFPCQVDLTSVNNPAAKSTSASKGVPPKSNATPSRDYFTVGSTKDEVLKVQGTPTSFDDQEWWYGSSKVIFDTNNRVKTWDISVLNPLKAKLIPKN